MPPAPAAGPSGSGQQFAPPQSQPAYSAATGGAPQNMMAGSNNASANAA